MASTTLPPYMEIQPAYQCLMHSMKARISKQLLATFLLGASILLSQTTKADDYFDFVLPWKDLSSGITNLSFLNSSPAGSDGFVTVHKGHLYTGEKRLKLLGVNLVFQGTTPDHDTADQIAKRLASFGVNAVRFHHMDSGIALKGLLNEDKRTLNADQLDRFDYFFAALKKNGIYSNINLQVIRVYPGYLPSPDHVAWKTAKGIDIFYPEFIALQKEYAQSLLLHRNPYTGNRYVDEPALALVEINNENGLIHSWNAGHIDLFNEKYREHLLSLWKKWLDAKYGSEKDRLITWNSEWTKRKDILESGQPKSWKLQISGGGKARLISKKNEHLQIKITRPATESWGVQLHRSGIPVDARGRYLVELKVRSNQDNLITISVMQNHAPWMTLWRQRIKTGTEWKTISSQFIAPYKDANTRITVSGFGQSKGEIEISSARLFEMTKSGTNEPKSFQPDQLTLPTKASFDRRSMDERNDWLSFLWDTEKSYWEDMKSFLKNALQVKAPLIGTQSNWYSPAAIQSTFDVIDSHGYWDHPQYPRKKYDIHDWTMHNQPMAGGKDLGPIADLSLSRIIGKPFVVTEYDHPFPNPHSAEGMPLLSAYAALQDWDGIFQFCYGLGEGDWNSTRVAHFYDSHANPVKMVGLLSAALMFRNNDIRPSKNTTHTPEQFDTTPAVWQSIIQTTQRMPNASDFGVDRRQAAHETVGFNITNHRKNESIPELSDTHELSWKAKESVVTINAARSKGIIGLPSGRIVLGEWGLRLASPTPERGVLLIHAIDGDSFKSAKRILIIAMGRVRNARTAESTKKSSSDTPWSGGSTQLSVTPAEIDFPYQTATAWALDEVGSRKKQIPILKSGMRNRIKLSEHTIWYEIELSTHQK